MDSTLRVAHISDLHCNGSDKWVDQFDYVRDSLVDIAPNLIIITGDSVNSPTKKQFRVLSNSIQDLHNSVKQVVDHEVYVLTIPGNHDYHPRGNKILSFVWPFGAFGKRFYTSLGNLNFPSGKLQYKDIVLEIFRKTRIAIFPIDSNKSSKIKGFAQGRVDHPTKVFREYRSLFMEEANNIGATYDDCIKIAVLHHHPLPVPTTENKEKEEGFLILQNAHDFLGAAEDHGISIIMHGHKHKSSLSEFRSIGTNTHSIVVSACASTAKLKEPKRQIRVLAISRNGAVKSSTYSSEEVDSKFTNKQLIPTPILHYSECRKRRFANKEHYNTDTVKSVDRMHSKTKVVTIKDDGDAAIVISMEGIEWNTSIRKEGLVLREYFRADIGRIPFGWTTFNDRDERGQSSSRLWMHPANETYDADRPYRPEAWAFSVNVDANVNTRELGFCKIKYPLFNGYMLNEHDHEEAYGSLESNLTEETCSIQAHYPTEVLELIVRFHSEAEQAFPSKDSIYVDSYRRLDEEAEQTLTILERGYCDLIDADENNFLADKHAIRYRPEIMEFALIVRYPQPNMVYTLRWQVSSDSQLAQLTLDASDAAERLRSRFCNPRDRDVHKFHGELSDRIRDVLEDTSLDIVLLGHDKERQALVVTQGPEKFDTATPLRIGRGVAGKSFRTRRIYYWENDPIYSIPLNLVRQEPERVIADFDPVAVLALPLSYPRIVTKEWEMLKSLQKDGRCPVFGILSIIAYNRPNSLSKFNTQDASGLNDKDMEEAFGLLYATIETLLEPLISDR